ncbi:MAG: SDR family oxidoreductase [Hyphomicrobiales bacterium]|nr:SDR family oxidoreductase [Hyphomicrobiales bacterium]
MSAADLARRNDGTRAIVTGGGQGIGFAIAKRLVAEGCRKLVLVGRSEEKGRKAVAELSASGADVRFVSADLGRVEDCRRVVEAALGAFGTVNALVNAAGSSERGSILDTTPEVFDRLFAINVRGPFFLMQSVVKALIDAGEPGSIVNVLSMSGHGGQPFLAPYSSSKGALATLTKNVAYAHRGNRIRCNAVLPGWMDTPGEDEVQKKWHAASNDWLAQAEAASPMGQLVKPDQLADLVCYLLSPQSGVITGSLIDYDQNVVGTSD